MVGSLVTVLLQNCSPDSDSEISLKIGQYFMKLRRTKKCAIFGPRILALYAHRFFLAVIFARIAGERSSLRATLLPGVIGHSRPLYS